MFTELLCQLAFISRLANRLRLGSIARIDPREEGKPRTSNVTKFLASCSVNGLPPEDFFRETISSRARPTASHAWQKAIITLFKWAETSVPTRSPILREGGAD
ncbi:hypothetical protein EI94DRAFT_128554 [Lactarius quietus]|nr:hypothetical protein EI94DRAFT_128554 [Lactarius quietus]